MCKLANQKARQNEANRWDLVSAGLLELPCIKYIEVTHGTKRIIEKFSTRIAL